MSTTQTLVLSLITLLTISGVYLAVEDKQTLEMGTDSVQDFDRQELFDLYNNWKQLYGKLEEHNEFRFNNFIDSYKKIMSHNAKKSSYKLGFNKFADISDEEFTAIYLMKTQTQEEKQERQKSNGANEERNPSKYFNGYMDFREKGVVNPVQSQGKCGSCYTFAGAQALESAYALQTDKGLLKFSEQQLVSCSQPYGNDGCDGGFGNATFGYVIDHGITLASKLPYVSGANREVPLCKVQKGEYFISSYTHIVGDGNCSAIQKAAQKQPLYARVVAEDWKLYDSGVFDSCTIEDANKINHGVGIVGFNTENSDTDKNYWIIRNSWGEDWGERGYMKLQFGNSCAICNDSYYPTV